MTTQDEANAQQRAMVDGRTHWHGCWLQHIDCMDRRIDERIAAALEQVAGRAYVVRIEVALQNTAKNLREEAAAELRAAEPASEPTAECTCRRSTNAWEYCQVHRKVRPAPAPPPSLVERLRREIMIGTAGILAPMLTEACDALEAAQADTRRLDALERLGQSVKEFSIAINPGESLRSVADALAATMERKP